MADRQADEKSIFLAAIEIDSIEERNRYLDDACGDDPALRAGVESLLREHQTSQGLLDTPAAAAPTIDSAVAVAECPGTQIGPYKLLQQIGEGGMGSVFLAEQKEPVERRVALKIIKPGMDSRQVIARFEAERQALAMMDHPNIAHVLDAGTTGSGRPYFVMELVRGVPITEYCDQEHLTPRERLELFIPVCQAIQHAHQKGIIHRDIKPSNVLVALYDSQPVPKVIDFGVAKAISQRLTEKTMFTQHGQIVGTLEYMSPEQSQLNQLDIDTRSDVYSLGVLLYELLTGDTPLDRQRLRSAAFDEIMRMIREEEPLRPSARLSTSDTLASVAASRRVEPQRLSTLVRGELDWIVMKSLEKDRARRYETASGLADDVQRYLHDERVQACPPSARYRFRKFARRNKVALTTAALITTALLLGIVATTWQAIRATRAERRARTAAAAATREAQRANDEAARANREAAIAQAVNEFLNDDLLAEAAPENEPDRDIKLRTVVDRAAEGIEGRFADQPLVEAAIRMTLGRTYSSLGEYERAERHLQRARELRERELGREHAETLKSLNSLANVYKAQSRYEQAEKLHSGTLEIRRRTLGAEHPDTLASMNNLANVYERQGRYEDAENLHSRTLDIRRRTLGEEHPDALGSMNNLANIYLGQGRYEDAEKLYSTALEIKRRTLGKEHPTTLNSMNNLARVYAAQGSYEDAEKLHSETLEMYRRTLGEEHPDTLASMTNLANVYLRQGRSEDAEKLYARTLEIERRTLGEEHPQTLRTVNNLAVVCFRRGRYERAEQLHSNTLEIRRRLLGEEHPSTLGSMNNLAIAYHVQRRYEDAVKLYAKTLEITRRTLGEEHPHALDTKHNLAEANKALGRCEEAERLHSEALEVWRRKCGDEHPSTLRSMSSLAWLLATCADLTRRDPAKAVLLANELTELAPQEGSYWNTLGVAQYRSGNWQAAIEALEKSIEIRLRSGGDGSDYFFQAMAHWQLGEKEQARTWYDRATQWMDNNRPDDEELKRFRAEATELLGMEAASPHKANTEPEKPKVESAVDDAEESKDRLENHGNGDTARHHNFRRGPIHEMT